MLRDEALNMARILMDKRGLWEWRVATTDGSMTNKSIVGYLTYDLTVVVPIEVEVQVLARCFRPLQLILLSGPVVDAMTIEGVREMVLHEIAHALTTGSHDEAWVAVARSIGCTGRESIDPAHYAARQSSEEATA